MANPLLAMARPVRFLASLTVSLAVLANAASVFLQSGNPLLSLDLNPLNQVARSNLLYDGLVLQKAVPDEAGLQGIARTGIEVERYAGGAYSLYGIAEEHGGRTEEAQAYYKHALALLPTEIQALLRRLDYELKKGEIEQAYSHSELVIRRWPAFVETLAPTLAALLTNEAARNLAAERFPDLPGGPSFVIGKIVAAPGGIAVATDLATRWYEEGKLDQATRNAVTLSMLQQGAGSAAYFFFRNTVSPEIGEIAKFVFDGNFTHPEQTGFFAWNLGKLPGAEIDIVPEPPMATALGTGNVLRIRLFGTPVNIRHPLQITKLPPRKMILAVKYLTNGFEGPAPLGLRLYCPAGKVNLGTLELAASDRTARTAEMEFTVPQTGCDLVQLSLSSRTLAKSWLNKYTGEIYIGEVSITSAGN